MKTPDTLPASAVELPPNKAIAAAGGSSLAGAITAITLWALGAQPPVEVIVAITTLVNAIVATVATYLTPHGAVVKEN